MEDILQIACYEGDEERKECFHLQQCLSCLPNLNESNLNENMPNIRLTCVV
jgi:hypothetical protein